MNKYMNKYIHTRTHIHIYVCARVSVSFIRTCIHVRVCESLVRKNWKGNVIRSTVTVWFQARGTKSNFPSPKLTHSFPLFPSVSPLSPRRRCPHTLTSRPARPHCPRPHGHRLPGMRPPVRPPARPLLRGRPKTGPFSF